MKNHIKDLYQKHQGQVIVCMGGAPSLERQMPVRGDVFISCNDHAVRLYGADYIVSMDWGINRQRMDRVMAKYNTPLICPFVFADHQIITRGLGDVVNSGVLSAFVAYQMGASRIVMAGFEWYQGPVNYAKSKRKVKPDNKKTEYKDRCIDRLYSLVPRELLQLL